MAVSYTTEKYTGSHGRKETGYLVRIENPALVRDGAVHQYGTLSAFELRLPTKTDYLAWEPFLELIADITADQVDAHDGEMRVRAHKARSEAAKARRAAALVEKTDARP
jgi:hypothetical protein